MLGNNINGKLKLGSLMEHTEDIIRKSFTFHERFHKYSQKILSNAKQLFNSNKFKRKNHSNRYNSKLNLDKNRCCSKDHQIYPKKDDDAVLSGKTKLYCDKKQNHLKYCGKKLNFGKEYLFIGVHVR